MVSFSSLKWIGVELKSSEVRIIHFIKSLSSDKLSQIGRPTLVRHVFFLHKNIFYMLYQETKERRKPSCISVLSNRRFSTKPLRLGGSFYIHPFSSVSPFEIH